MLGLGSFEAMSSAHVIILLNCQLVVNTIANLGSAARPAVEANV
jgi:hypothetical protein